MYFFVILCSLLIAVYGVSDSFVQDIKIQMMDTAAVCVPQTGANEADIAELLAKKHPSRREGKCLISCFLKTFGIQGEDGKPNKENTLALLEPIHDDDPDMYAKLIHVALKCGPEVYSFPLTDHCDIALEIGACVMREGRLLGVEDPFVLQG